MSAMDMNAVAEPPAVLPLPALRDNAEPFLGVWPMNMRSPESMDNYAEAKESRFVRKLKQHSLESPRISTDVRTT